MSGRLNIVVADDDADMRQYLQESLEYLGHEVRAAADGRQLVTLCREFVPDLVVTDLAMPGLDGLAASAEINRERYVPVILISGRHDAESRAMHQSHVVSVLLKPIKPAELKATIDSVAGMPVCDR